MTGLTERAPAKLNLGRTLGPTRADGRHELVTIMQPVELCDTVRLLPAQLGDAHDEVICPGVEGDNLALAALLAFRARSGWTGAPVRLEIEKRNRQFLAGPSVRAAGLRDDDLLREIAAGLGADVPAQVRPRRYLATGAGEVLSALPDPPPFGVLVVCSEHGLSTADVFREADRLGLARSGAELAARGAELVATLAAGSAMPDPELLVNDLQRARGGR